MARNQRFDGIIIAHLGNIDGRQPKRENTLTYLNEALKAGWHICVDVVFRNGGFCLPNERGMTPAPPAFFSKQRVWCRTRDADTLDALCNVGAHAFFASTDPMTLTSSQFVWTLPPANLSPRAIACFPELTDADWLERFEPAGICTNSPAQYV